MAAPSVRLNEENPWPWLDAFDEASARYFNGRTDDAAKLLRMVRGSPATVLFGKSGLGKTSLLRAGLFPRLRDERLLPIYVRLRHDEDAPPPLEQIWQRFLEACQEANLAFREEVSAEPERGPDFLWLYLHHRPLGLGPDGSPWQPIFVLDQFEEVFTVGADDVTRQEKFFADLGDLIENRVPASVAALLQESDDLLDSHDLDMQSYRFLISLREDYLADLERWSDQIPRLGPNRYRLLPMTRAQALEAVEKTGGALVTSADAVRIVEYVAASADAPRPVAKSRGRSAVTEFVEPALLSLVCSGLNWQRRKANGEGRLDTSNLSERGGEILERFYDERLADMPREIRELIENELITPDGIRRQYPLESAIAADGNLEAQINRLVDRRILRIEPVGDRRRIELVHDRVAAVALKRKQEADLQEQARRLRHEQQEAARRLKRNTILGAAFATVLALIAAGMFVLWQRAEQSRKDATAASYQATSLGLLAESLPVVELSRPGGTMKAVLQVLAAHRMQSGIEPYFALQSTNELLSRSKRVILSSAPVSRVVFSPNGELVLSANEDSTLRLWDAKSGQPMGEPLIGHDDIAYSVAFSPDGKRIVSGSADTTVRLWDAVTNKQIGAPLKGHTDAVYSVDFSPDGNHIVSGGADNTVRLWDAESGKPLGEPLKGHGTWVYSVAFSPDGNHVASGSGDQTVRIWSLATRKQIIELNGHTATVYCVAFSPDGNRVVSASGGVYLSPSETRDYTLRLWDVATGKEIGALNGHAATVYSVAFSSDGKRIVSGSADKSVRLWDAATGKQIGELNGHTATTTSVAFSPDGKSILSGSDDHTVRLWNAGFGDAIGGPVIMQGHTNFVYRAAISSDGKRIVSGGADNAVRLWDTVSGDLFREFKGHTGWVHSVAFSRDGTYIVSGSADKTIRVWKLEPNHPVRQFLNLQGHTANVYSVGFSPDGKRIVSGSADTTVRLWDAATGSQIGELNGHTATVYSVAFSPDGKYIVSGSVDNSVRLWDFESKKLLREFKGHTATVHSVAFSPDGKRIVSGSGGDYLSWSPSQDYTLRLWDTASGKQIGLPLKGHTDAVYSVAFSPDGRHIVSGSADKTVRIWETDSGKPVGKPLRSHADHVRSVAFSSDGKRIVSGSFDKTLRLWPVLEAWADELCAKLTRNMTMDEWKKWVGDFPYRRQCPDLPGPPDETLPR